MIDGTRVTSLVMLAVFVAMTGAAWSFPPEARLLPLVVGIPGTVMALAQVVLDLRRRPSPKPDTPWRREAAYLAWFATLVGAVVVLGFLSAAPLWVFAFLRRARGERIAVAAALALACPAVIYLLFEFTLGLTVFRGLLFTAVI